MPVRVIRPVQRLFRALSARASGAYRPVFSLMSAVPAFTTAVLSRLGDEPRAMLRSTMAITTMSSGDSLNAMPGRATATLNVRLLPGQSLDEVIAHVHRVVADDGVRVEALNTPVESGISPDSGPAWDRLVGVLAETLPEVIPAPYLQLGATDSRQFWRISDRVYRFIPYELTTQERAGMHGVDERMPVRAFLRGLPFYETLVRGL